METALYCLVLWMALGMIYFKPLYTRGLYWLLLPQLPLILILLGLAHLALYLMEGCFAVLGWLYGVRVVR